MHENVNNGKKEVGLRRELGFWEIFFMSIGGQAPFLSMLTYATAVMVLALYFSPLVVIIGTAVVLLNGIVVYFLSKKHTETGGYFNYAFKSLSRRFGFETGWVYIFYSIMYGAGYIVGSTFVLNYILGIPPILAFIIVFVPTSLFMVFGIKPSAKYAVFAASLEIVILVFVTIVTLYFSHFQFYNPIAKLPSAQGLFLGILFAIGIPTGYGAITPISGEVVDAHKNVGRAAISVIIIGGLLEAFVLYGLIDAAIHGQGLASILQSQIPVITVMRSIVGPFSTPLLIFVAVNDGILGSMAFFTACARTIYALSGRGFIHKIFSSVSSSNIPRHAVLTTIFVSAIVMVPVLFFISPFTFFLLLGTVAGLANLIIHMFANGSLVRENLSRFIRNFKALIFGIVALFVSGFVLVYSLLTSTVFEMELVLGTIISGFVVVEAIEIHKSKDREDIHKATAMSLRESLLDVVVKDTDSVLFAINKCASCDSPGAIVLGKDNKPVGTFYMKNIRSLNPEMYQQLKISEVYMGAVVSIKPYDNYDDILSLFNRTGVPIMVIVKEDGRFIGTLREIELFRYENNTVPVSALDNL
jgi:amino acid transporter